jgi:hypothetical protein
LVDFLNGIIGYFVVGLMRKVRESFGLRAALLPLFAGLTFRRGRALSRLRIANSGGQAPEHNAAGDPTEDYSAARHCVSPFVKEPSGHGFSAELSAPAVVGSGLGWPFILLRHGARRRSACISRPGRLEADFAV